MRNNYRSSLPINESFKSRNTFKPGSKKNLKMILNLSVAYFSNATYFKTTRDKNLTDVCFRCTEKATVNNEFTVLNVILLSFSTLDRFGINISV